MLWEAILDGLYPRRCPLCGDIVVPRGELACPSCHAGRQRIREPRCLRCGKQLRVAEVPYCRDCEGKAYTYTRGFALWEYDAVMRKSIQDFKYHGRQEYAEYYVQQLLEEYGEQLRSLDPEAVIPVPIHRKRRQRRGYNQAELLAEGIAEALEIPLLQDYLMRSRDTVPQKELNPTARRRNLQSAFQINQRSKAWRRYWKRVLLVDDIYTTGSTVEACSQILRQAGTGEIYVLCLCIGHTID